MTYAHQRPLLILLEEIRVALMMNFIRTASHFKARVPSYWLPPIVTEVRR